MKNLCFAGGGMKGIAYIGVYRYLLEHNVFDTLKNMSGTSVGALISLCIILRYTPEELEVLIKKLSYSLIEDLDIKNFTKRYSIDTGNKIEYIIKKIIMSKGLNPMITFKELYNLTKIGLYVCATDLRDYSKKIFDHTETPDTPVYLACKYSISIPFLWSSDGYADGCLSSNLPISYFDITSDTLGVICRNKSTPTKINNIKDYTMKIIKCCLYRANSYEIDFYREEGYRILVINIPPVQNLDFDLPEETKDELIKIGYDSAKSLKMRRI